MKSPMVQTADYLSTGEKSGYTDLQVMRSGGGWYVGTYYNNPDGYQEPGSRDSGYYATKEAAEKALADIIAGLASTRMTP